MSGKVGMSGILMLGQLLLLTVSLAAGPGPMPVYNIKDYGAVGDGRVKNTGAIQQAVDEANEAGGGRVYFPPGDYISGTIILKSGVTLYLETGATLLGSTDTLDYPSIRPAFRSFTDGYVSQSLIFAEKQNDIGIAGRGTINGQGEHFQWKEYGNRPDVIRFVSCKYVNVQDVRLRNSAMWMQHYLNCEFVTVRGIHVSNHSTYNNDMIDIDCCRNVTISDCYGNSDDDALTLKSTADHPTENVTVTNCVLGSGCNAIKMGTESNGGFKNISITNCTIDSRLDDKGFYGLGERGSAGIALEIVDGGTLENITISNITIKNVNSPLFLRLGNRARPFIPGGKKPGVGTWRNVVISNIIATELGDYGCSILGIPDKSIENVTLSNIRMRFPGGGTSEHASTALPEKIDSYPDAWQFGTLPAWGFFCRHVDGLRMENIDIELETEDARPAMVFDDVANLDLDGLSERRAVVSDAPTVVLRDVRDAGIRACRPLSETPVFMLLQGTVKRISAIGNEIPRAGKLFATQDGADSEEVFQASNRIGK
jgi:hypothetical protein